MPNIVFSFQFILLGNLRQISSANVIHLTHFDKEKGDNQNLFNKEHLRITLSSRFFECARYHNFSKSYVFFLPNFLA